MVPADGTAERSAELIALERRDLGTIEKPPGIQRAVAQEFVSGAMNLIGARASDSVYDSSRRLAVLGRVVAGQDRKLLNSVYAEVSAKYAAGTAIGIIVNADAINSVIVLL